MVSQWFSGIYREEAPPRKLIVEWITDAWNKLGGDIIEKSFKAGVLNINVDESEGSRIHCFKQNQRSVYSKKYCNFT